MGPPCTGRPWTCGLRGACLQVRERAREREKRERERAGFWPRTRFFFSTPTRPLFSLSPFFCAELLLRRPWLPGTSDLAQLGLIFGALGTPAPGEWPAAPSLPGYVAFAPRPRPDLAAAFPPGTGGDALDLLARLCALDPAARPTAEEALKHRYFTGGVPAT